MKSNKLSAFRYFPGLRIVLALNSGDSSFNFVCVDTYTDREKINWFKKPNKIRDDCKDIFEDDQMLLRIVNEAVLPLVNKYGRSRLTGDQIMKYLHVFESDDKSQGKTIYLLVKSHALQNRIRSHGQVFVAECRDKIHAGLNEMLEFEA